MSQNMIDFTIFERLHSSAESAHQRIFATHHKYVFKNIVFLNDDINIKFELLHVNHEANDKRYSEVVIKKTSEIQIQNLYKSNFFENLIKAIDLSFGAYFLIEVKENEIELIAKIKGQIPSSICPEINIIEQSGVRFNFETRVWGTDANIFCPSHLKNKVHLPRTSFGDGYKTPKKSDRLIFIDSIDPLRDRTFTREVIHVEENASCTCDVLELDLPIDRLDNDFRRIDGIGLHRPSAQVSHYTAKFNQVKIFKRVEERFNHLKARNSATGLCARPIGQYANMKVLAPQIVKQYIKNSEQNLNPAHKMQYFGGHFNWHDFKSELSMIHQMFGEYLCEDLFILTSNKNRPEYLLHIDYDHDNKNRPVTASFTWPALNCTSDSITVWYEALKNKKKFFGEKRDIVYIENDIELIEKDRFVFNSEEFNAVIFKHDDWHTVYNNSNSSDQRILLQWRFKPDLSWEEVLEITKNIA